MSWCRRIVLCLVLFIGPDICCAASPEDSAFNQGALVFQIGLWETAEKDFEAFTQKFPKSPRVPEAILLQAQSRFQLGRYPESIALLAANQNTAGKLEDEYVYWIAQSHFQNANHAAAAEVFAQLAATFPESPRRIEATVGEAAARARLKDWNRIVETLRRPEGWFQQAANAATNDVIINGQLLLAEALHELNQSPEARGILQRTGQGSGDLEWRRQYLLCRIELAEDRVPEALSIATNLVVLADGLRKPVLLAESVDLQGAILERAGRFTNAVAVYRGNLSTSAPVEQQRAALLKVTELSMAHGLTGEAIQTLQQFLAQQNGSGAMDMALLALGELRMKQHFTVAETNQTDLSSATNVLRLALNHFDTLLTRFTNSPLTGKALLNKGWCFWAGGDFVSAETNFREAVQQLPRSEDQAIARFKWADTQFVRKNFEGALTNYEALAVYADIPSIKSRHLEQALYQAVRSAIASTNAAAAKDAMRKILEWYPDGFAGPNCLLLVGEGLARQSDPAGAREWFAEFERQYPTNALLPEVRLAIARSYERGNDWAGARAEYEKWIATFPDHPKLPTASFYYAWNTYMLDDAASALNLFTNFVARFPTDPLAPQAQWWVADYYFHLDSKLAERNYRAVCENTNWPVTRLTYEARMMAGHCAALRFDYSGAIVHFTNLTLNPRCPPDIKARALFAYGDAQMNQPDENNPLGKWRAAIEIFNGIPLTNDLAPLARGRIGECNLQLASIDPGGYILSSNAFQQVLSMPRASASARHLARLGLAKVVEKQAELEKNSETQTALYRIALNQCLEVLKRMEEPDGEKPDAFALKEAGIKAGRYAELLNLWPQALALYEKLDVWLPTLHATWDVKIQNARKNIVQ